jgi:hypothetical protein
MLEGKCTNILLQKQQHFDKVTTGWHEPANPKILDMTPPPNLQKENNVQPELASSFSSLWEMA